MEKILLSKPVIIDGKEFTHLEFDFDELTGIDSLDAETEIRAMGKTPTVLEADKAYLAAIAARAMKPKQVIDFILKLPIKDFTAVTAVTQAFLFDLDTSPTESLEKI